MNMLDARFYWDTAKFFFSAVGGGTAAYCLVKGINNVASKAGQLAEMQAVSQFMPGSKEEDTGAEALDV